jgi:transmembrane 9 superfamily protein 2/4
MRLRRPQGPSASISPLLLLLLSPLPTFAFYLPGIAPTSYKTGELVPLLVNRLSPSDSEESPNVASVYSYDYYRHEFNFCARDPTPVSESLGSIVWGDRIWTADNFELKMGVDESCKAVCEPVSFDGEDGAFVNQRILQNYNLNWLIDGLPAGQMKEETNTGVQFESPGFPLGSVDERDGSPILNTHYDITIQFHEAATEQYRVVGIIVEPSSRSNAKIVDGVNAECGDTGSPQKLSETGRTRVLYTYSVRWQASSTPFATRWDKYLHVYDPKIHWFSLINSAVIVCFLIGMVSTILIRTLHKDIARYNRLDAVALEDLSGTGVMDDGVQEDSGWKLVHGDVFRPPKYPLPLSVLLGNGAQLFMMTGFTIGNSSSLVVFSAY